jgi:pimeloyl-ACP methyl ester carboxylesterase
MSSPTPTPTLVNIGTHCLALYTHGPAPSHSNDPVVLFVSGIASSSLVWSAVTRRLASSSSSVRSYTYDRSGFGASDQSPLAPTAENIALELSYLINGAPIKNPLVLVGHSWAGVLVREFLTLTGNGPHIAGIVFVDANQERSLQVLNVLDVNLRVLFAGAEYLVDQGIAAEHKLTHEDWDAFVSEEATQKFKLQSAKEEKEYEGSFQTLRRKELGKGGPLLGNKPMFVIGSLRSRDWGRMYNVGVARGNGTELQRKYVREIIETADLKSEGLMQDHLKLSTKGKLVSATESGHFVQLTQPDIVVDGVNWVLKEMHASS